MGGGGASDVALERLAGCVRAAHLLLGGAQEDQRPPLLLRRGGEVEKGGEGRRGLLEPALLEVDLSQALQRAPLVPIPTAPGDGIVDGLRLFHVAVVAQLVGQVQVKGNVRR